MKLEQLAAIGEIVSSVAIVATLGYLTLQTQQTNSALYASSRAQIMSADVAVILEQVDAPYSEFLRDRVQAAMPADVSRTPDRYVEWNRELNLMSAALRIREFAWFQYQQGILDEATWSSYMQATISRLSGGRGSLIWGVLSSQLNADFVDEVNRRIATLDDQRLP